MRKVAFGLVFFIFLCGCADYRGLNQISIVSGIALDLGECEGHIRATFELVVTDNGKSEGGKKTHIVRGEGASFFEAVGAANLNLGADLYFGNAELLIIGEELAKEAGLSAVLEPFLRETWVRDTLLIVISRGMTGAEILEASPDIDYILSYEISKALDWQKKSFSSTHPLQLYQLYDELKAENTGLGLPAIGLDTEDSPALFGLGVFEGDVLRGFLDSAYVPFFKLLHEPLNDGVFTFFLDDDEDMAVTLSIGKSKPALKCRKEGGFWVLAGEIEVVADVVGASPAVGNIEEKKAELEEKAGVFLAKRAAEVIEYMQNTFEIDIFGFGKSLYIRDAADWAALKNQWSGIFSSAQVEILCTVKIRKTGLLTGF